MSIAVLLSLKCLLTAGGVESICLYLSRLSCFVDGLGLTMIWIGFADIFLRLVCGRWM